MNSDNGIRFRAAALAPSWRFFFPVILPISSAGGRTLPGLRGGRFGTSRRDSRAPSPAWACSSYRRAGGWSSSTTARIAPRRIACPSPRRPWAVVSTLYGAALEKDLAPPVDARIEEILGRVRGNDNRFHSLTVRHFLMMTTGLDEFSPGADEPLTIIYKKADVRGAWPDLLPGRGERPPSSRPSSRSRAVGRARTWPGNCSWVPSGSRTGAGRPVRTASSGASPAASAAPMPSSSGGST